MPCFTPGTSIATSKGERLIEDLRAGDEVITRDHGIQRIVWSGRKAIDWQTFAANRYLRPVLLRMASLGHDRPDRDMMVSPNMRFVVTSDQTMLPVSGRDALIAAKNLINHRGVHEIESMGTHYIHFFCERNEMVLANGVWVECFNPTDSDLGRVGNAQRTELLELFPELRQDQPVPPTKRAATPARRWKVTLLNN